MPLALAWYLLASLTTLGAFMLDKRAANRGTRRTRERTLHLLELLGGWPGALLAMHLLRHKRRKPSYWLVTGAIGAAHIAAWAWLLFTRA